MTRKPGRALSLLALVLILLTWIACRPPQKPKAEVHEGEYGLADADEQRAASERTAWHGLCIQLQQRLALHRGRVEARLFEGRA
jgi:hypothetical protein